MPEIIKSFLSYFLSFVSLKKHEKKLVLTLYTALKVQQLIFCCGLDCVCVPVYFSNLTDKRGLHVWNGTWKEKQVRKIEFLVFWCCCCLLRWWCGSKVGKDRKKYYCTETCLRTCGTLDTWIRYMTGVDALIMIIFVDLKNIVYYEIWAHYNHKK